jgi:hypothetical protein
MEDLDEYVFDLLNRSSGANRIKVVIDDQNNIERSDSFKDNAQVSYRSIWWDEWISPVQYQVESIEKARPLGFDYVLIMSQKVNMPNGWDIDLINKTKDESIISGIGKISPKINNFFNISKNETFSENMTNTSFLDHRFVFMKTMIYKILVFPTNLKYYGIDEYLSMQLLNHGKSIWSLSNEYSYINESILDKDYIPFSLYHNYNDVVNIIKGKESRNLEWIDPLLFINAINLKVDSLYPFPYDVNDIEYSTDFPIDNKSLNKLFSNINTLS